jgi:hypothetical protein
MPSVASLIDAPSLAHPFDASADRSVDQAVVRLAEEFNNRVGPHRIVRVVRDCRRDLGGSPVGALPELVERLARIRLSEAITE